MSNYLNPDNSPAERAVTAKMQENPTPTRAALGSTARGLSTAPQTTQPQTTAVDSAPEKKITPVASCKTYSNIKRGKGF